MIGILDIFTFIVLAVLLAVAIFCFMKLGELPGKIASRRNHPQADAITICGWLGVLTLGLLWPIAIIWAYMRPADSRDKSNDIDLLRERMDVLEEKLQDLNKDKEHSPQ
jgi:hypothetical protein